MKNTVKNFKKNKKHNNNKQRVTNQSAVELLHVPPADVRILSHSADSKHRHHQTVPDLVPLDLHKTNLNQIPPQSIQPAKSPQDPTN